MTLGRLGVALIAIAGGVLLAYWGLVFAVQRKVIFPAPPALDSGPLPGPDVEQVWLEIDGARSEAWFLPAVTASAAAPLIVYAHGNGELIDGWLTEFAVPRAWGVSVLLVEYPGYGRSSGKPSQASITRAFTAAYDWAARQQRVDAGRVIGYGRSLGGGAICALARERALAALVLESTFTSLRDQAHAYGAPGFLVRDPFDNLARVREFRGPILLLHGEHDDSIPVEQARRLHAASPASELHVLACGHNDCAPPWPLLKDFLREQHLL